MKNMNLFDIIHRNPNPAPWAEGEKIAWDDPDFSERILAEHLSQEHDEASRRTELIDAHVEWLHQKLLNGESSRILDLGCGPGLYTNRLAKLGHTCTGIDFSPAAIRYAHEMAQKENLSCKYAQSDIREADFGTGYDLVMMLFGETNVFKKADLKQILQKTKTALDENGTLLLEAHTFEAVQAIGEEMPLWYSEESGLFSEKLHKTHHVAHLKRFKSHSLNGVCRTP
ncbi:MAG: class I SAM-dependent methyltransferase [Anaerolineae bacterium]|nr:class I SAM-dependent methyltransferase [Anaerolineae bacterium]